MTRSKVLLIILVALGLGGMVQFFYESYAAARQREEAARQAMDLLRKKEEDARARAVAAEAKAEAAAKAETAAKAAAPKPTPTPNIEPEVAQPGAAVPGAPAPSDLIIGTPRRGAPTSTSGNPPSKPVFLGPEPPADQPRPPVIAAAENWIRANKLTSVLLGNPPVAIFGRYDYRPGGEILLGRGLKMRVDTISDGFVEFSTPEGYRFRTNFIDDKRGEK